MKFSSNRTSGDHSILTLLLKQARHGCGENECPSRHRFESRRHSDFASQNMSQKIQKKKGIHIWDYTSILRHGAIVDKVDNINMAQISKKLGENIKRIRLRRKMSQGDICRAIDMDRSYMSAIEGGKVNVTLAVLDKLAKALDVSVAELLK
jgi:ribosome-binding protein aMBF1 (putative translation factor)